MIDLKERLLELRHAVIIKGNRPIFINIQKGDYPYQKKYVVTIEDEHLHFYQTKGNYRYLGEKARDFLIKFEQLGGYRWQTYKENYKKFILVFKDELEFTFIYPCGSDETYDNEANILHLSKVLKEKGIFQKNNLKSGNYGKQKTISKADQWFTQEIRSPKKRGLFK